MSKIALANNRECFVIAKDFPYSQNNFLCFLPYVGWIEEFIPHNTSGKKKQKKQKRIISIIIFKTDQNPIEIRNQLSLLTRFDSPHVLPFCVVLERAGF